MKNLKVLLKKLTLKFSRLKGVCCCVGAVDNQMKKKLNFLPPHKQAELRKLTEIIKKYSPAEIVILFGSYARNEWVEEKYDDEHWRYQSDFDILILVTTRKKENHEKIEQDLEAIIDAEKEIKTPVTLIVHDIYYVNQQLQKTHYFFSDIKRQGILLHDSKRYQLAKTKKLSPRERKRLAEEDYGYWLSKARNFYDGFKFYFEKQKYNEAAFLLHQVTESLYTTALMVFTRYKPSTHDIQILRKLTNSLDNRFCAAFLLVNPEDKRNFKLLRKAYVDARYKKSYTITQEELVELEKRGKQLQALVEELCKEKIVSFEVKEQIDKA